MSLRGGILAGTLVAALIVGLALAWPFAGLYAARSLEARLSAETGLPWKVSGVSLSLLPTPSVVAREVSFGEPERAEAAGPSGRIKQVRVADALSLLGSRGTLHVEAEGLSLRASSASLPASRAGGTVSALRAVLRGPSATWQRQGRAVTAEAESASLDLDRADNAAQTDIRLRIESQGQATDIALVTKAGAEDAPLNLTLTPLGGSGHSGQARATARFGSDSLKLDAVSGTIDQTPFSGSLDLGLGPVPKIGLDLRLEQLTLTGDESAAPGDTPEIRTKDGKIIVAVRPDFVPDVRWFEGIEAKGTVNVAKLGLGNAGIEGGTLSGTVKNGTLDVALASAALYGGQARGRYVLAPEAGGVGRHQLSLSLAKLRALPLLNDVAQVRGIDGMANGRLDLQATGSRLDAVVASLSGNAEVAVTDGRISGLDIASALGLLPRTGGDRTSLATRLERLAGRFEITDGQAVTNDVALKTGLIEATGIGRIDLPARTLDFRFKPQATAPAGSDRPRPRVDVPVRVAGPWSNPSVSADLSGLAENPSGAIQSLQDLGTNLFGDGKNGDNPIDGLGEALNGLLGGDGQGADKKGGGLGGLLDSFIPKQQPDRPRGRPSEPYRAPR